MQKYMLNVSYNPVHVDAFDIIIYKISSNEFSIPCDVRTLCTNEYQNFILSNICDNSSICKNKR